MHTTDRIALDAGLHVLSLTPRLAEPVTVGQHHGAHRRGDQQCRGGFQQHHVAREQQGGHALGVAAAGLVGLRQSRRPTDEDRLSDGEHEQTRQAEHRQDACHPLALEGLHHGVAAVDANQHHHEQEQHQNGACVDDDLHHEQERSVLGGVEDREPHHHSSHAEGRVNGFAGDNDADGQQHHDRRTHHEGDELTRQRGKGNHFTAPCLGAVRVSG